MIRPLQTGLLAAALLSGCQTTSNPAVPSEIVRANDCQIGIYDARDDDRFLVVTDTGTAQRYTYSDGETAHAAVCSDGFLQLAGSESVWTLRPIQITDTKFQTSGAVLAGQLLEPTGSKENTPLVVFAHGSEESGWIGAVPDLYQMVGRGVSVFVYDKRGTGQSTGQYSQNFPELARDLVAASTEAKKLADGRFGRFGLIGLSQGGWIAPMAAGRAEADFVGVGYGLVVDILEEDAAQVELELREAGHGEEIVAIGRQITNVTGRLAVSNYQDGLDDLDELKKSYGEEPWFQSLRGGFSGVLLNMSTDQLREDGIPMFDRLNIDWSLKPMDVLRDVDVPQFWALAKDDREAPVDTTLERLLKLRSEGQSITIHMFPDTDHGIRTFTQSEDGTRTYTGVSDGFYDLMADWAKGELNPPYGDSLER